MCMWVKENVRASCEAVRGDGAVRIRKEALRCVREASDVRGSGIAVFVGREGCVRMVRKY